MTSVPIIYDVTRLVTRILNAAPNGIDRIDFALARHFLGRPGSQALLCTAFGPRLISAQLAREAIVATEAWWNEQKDDDDPAYEAVVQRLSRPETAGGRIRSPQRGHLPRLVQAVVRYALRVGRAPDRSAARDAVYLHASQFLLDRAWYLKWLDRRSDVRPVFFIHDLLPLTCPEFFWPGEAERHRARLAALARRGAGAIVPSLAVADDLRTFMTSNGRSDLRICVAPPSVSPVFGRPARPDPRLAGVAFFVVCGTIEPRKNHLLLLEVWRELVRRRGSNAPKLVVVGKRGWHNENVLAVIDRSSALRNHVIEVSGLATPALRRLLGAANALLMPSVGEGFGLPVAEACAAGVPVIASALRVFAEVGHGDIDFIDPYDGSAWLGAIEARAEAVPQAPRRTAQHPRSFTSEIDRFLALSQVEHPHQNRRGEISARNGTGAPVTRQKP